MNLKKVFNTSDKTIENLQEVHFKEELLMKKLSIIYDVTALCPLNCAICCMGATTDKLCKKYELKQAEKLNIAHQVEELTQNGYDIKIDLSGGEIFTDIPNHKKLLTAFSSVLGKDKVGVSCSGYGIDKNLATFLGKTVNDVEMTMDVVPYRTYKLRPIEYSVYSAKAVSLLKDAGCSVGIQTVISSYNNNYTDTLAIFSWICANHVDNWSILRFFPSGRGANFPEATMSDEACKDYVHMVHNIVNSQPIDNKPKIDFHYLMPGHEKYTNVCRCVRNSIGILPNGDVVSCFWALDSKTGTINPKFYLGNVKKNSLLEILNSEKARYWSSCEHSCELCNSSNDNDILSA